MTALQQTAAYGFDDILHVLLTHAGADPNATSRAPHPLALACQNGRINCARVLLENGANVNYTTPLGDTPIFLAAEFGHADCVKLLLKNGANPHALNGAATSPVWIATKGNHPAVVELLVEAGADVNQPGGEMNEPPIIIAAQYGVERLIRALTMKQCNVNVVRKTDSASPLFISTLLGHVSASKALIFAGANPHLPSQTGLSAFHVACLRGSHELVACMIDAGADVNHCIISESLTPLHISARAGRVHVVERLLKARAHAQLTSACGLTPLELCVQGKCRVIFLACLSVKLTEMSQRARSDKNGGLVPFTVTS